MRVLVVEHEDGAGPGYFAGWLAGAGVECEVVRPYAGEAVPESAPGGLIVLGGEASAWDDDGYPWLPATRELLRRSVHGGVPTLGICLGAQLMTMACGGTVERGGSGLEVGARPVIPTARTAGDPLLGHLTGTPLAVQYHRDVMPVLPAGAVWLATGERYPHQAYRLGETAWAVQFHPEATPEIFTRWTVGSADYLTNSGFLVEELNAQVKRVEEELVAAWRPLAEGFAKVVCATRKSQ
jgi:GMP synthase (glutamine-hydrolysing)